MRFGKVGRRHLEGKKQNSSLRHIVVRPSHPPVFPPNTFPPKLHFPLRHARPKRRLGRAGEGAATAGAKREGRWTMMAGGGAPRVFVLLRSKEFIATMPGRADRTRGWAGRFGEGVQYMEQGGVAWRGGGLSRGLGFGTLSCERIERVSRIHLTCSSETFCKNHIFRANLNYHLFYCIFG